MSENDFPPSLQELNPDDLQEQNLRKKCAFYLMNPKQKFIATRQTPWKLIFQFVKLVFVSWQVILFGQIRVAHVNYFSDNHIALDHLFLRNCHG